MLIPTRRPGTKGWLSPVHDEHVNQLAKIVADESWECV